MGVWPANEDGWESGCGMRDGWACGLHACKDGWVLGHGVRDGLVGCVGWQARWGLWGGRGAGHQASVGRLCPTC